VAHLITSTPSKILKGKTPYEILFGRQPFYDHLQVFGCLWFAQNKRKTKDKRQICFLKQEVCLLGILFETRGGRFFIWKLYDHFKLGCSPS